MKFKHARRPGARVGFFDSFAAGIFLLFCMPLGGLQAEIGQMLGHPHAKMLKGVSAGHPRAVPLTLQQDAKENESLLSSARAV